MWLVMAFDTRIAISALGLCDASAGLTEFTIKNCGQRSGGASHFLLGTVGCQQDSLFCVTSYAYKGYLILHVHWTWCYLVLFAYT